MRHVRWLFDMVDRGPPSRRREGGWPCLYKQPHPKAPLYEKRENTDRLRWGRGDTPHENQKRIARGRGYMGLSSIEPNDGGNELDRCQEVSGGLVVSGGDAPELLESAKE